mmetsp:Transcript_104535/g.145661  ORF Transcript_104535/g.145661 Transcript_104535/m.145661 type:complete len:220 (+) Transcript_104535:257-916(+)
MRIPTGRGQIEAAVLVSRDVDPTNSAGDGLSDVSPDSAEPQLTSVVASSDRRAGRLRFKPAGPHRPHLRKRHSSARQMESAGPQRPKLLPPRSAVVSVAARQRHKTAKSPPPPTLALARQAVAPEKLQQSFASCHGTCTSGTARLTPWGTCSRSGTLTSRTCRRRTTGLSVLPTKQAWFLLTPGASLMIGVATTSTRPTGVTHLRWRLRCRDPGASAAR